MAIAVYEDSSEVNQFSSKYDAYLSACPEDPATCANCDYGTGTQEVLDANRIFTETEWLGFQLFVLGNNNDGTLQQNEGGNCAACHVLDYTSTPTALSQIMNKINPQLPIEYVGLSPQFTDYAYDNLGVPKNRDNPWYAKDPKFIDLGLGGVLNDPNEYGKHKVPTLRNVDKRPAKGFVGCTPHITLQIRENDG